MFSTLAEIMMELFAKSPAAFIGMTEEMIKFISDNNIVPFVFLIAVVLLVINVILEPDSFAFVSSLIKLLALFIVITLALDRWTNMVPVIGESISYELASIVTGGKGAEGEGSVCGKTRAEREAIVGSTYKDEGMRKAMVDSTSIMGGVCGKIEEAFSLLTTPITTSVDVKKLPPSGERESP